MPSGSKQQNRPASRADKIERRGRKWVVLSKDGGKVLGEHETRAAAMQQLRAVEAGKMDSVIRVSRGVAIHTDEARTDGVRAVRTPEGFLRADAYLTRAGVFRYSDGEREWSEYRDASEVFDDAALDSFRLAVVTDDHPEGMVTADTVATVQVGHVGSDVRRDGDFVRATILVTDAATIEKIDAGKCELSCGYTAAVIRDAGVTDDGTPYDTRQTLIRGNHVAIVDRGRAGPACRLRLDAGGAMETTDMKHKNKNAPDTGPEADTGPDTAPENKADTAPDAGTKADTTSAPDTEAKADTTEDLRARLDAVTAELDALRAGQAARIDARVRLVADAARILGDYDAAGKTDAEIQRDVIRTVAPSLAAKADAGSPEYVAACYDACLQLHADREATAGQESRAVFDALSGGESENDIDSIYDAFTNRKAAK